VLTVSFVFGYFSWSRVFWFPQLQYGWQQQNKYESGYEYDQKYQQVIRIVIHGQYVSVLSVTCKYNAFQEATGSCFCLEKQKKPIFQQ
jgi:hypothetical protein